MMHNESGLDDIASMLCLGREWWGGGKWREVDREERERRRAAERMTLFMHNANVFTLLQKSSGQRIG